MESIAAISLNQTLLITYSNPFNEHSESADLCFVGRTEIIQGIKLGVRLGLKMNFFSTDREIIKFAGEFLEHYTS